MIKSTLLLFCLLLPLLAHEDGTEHSHEAEHLFQQHCFACHKFQSQELAPPPFAIRRVYTDRFKDTETAHQKIAAFLLGKGESIMKPAVQKFGAMALIPISKQEADLLAAFIIAGNFPKPGWFDKHYQEHLDSGALTHEH